MERTFGPGSSQDGEGEVDDDLQEEPESAPPPPLQNGAIPRHPDPFTTQEGPFLNSETQAARMRPPVVEHQVSSGNPYPNQPTQMGHPYANHPPPDPHQHRHAPNGQFLSGSYAPPLPNGTVPFLPPAPPFPPPLEHDHLYPEPAPPPPPAVDEPSAEDEESGRPRRERAKRDFFSAGSHSGSGGGPSEDGGATGTGSRKGKEKERSSRSHHYDGAGRKSRQEPTGHRKVKVIKRDVPADLECSFCEGDKTRNRDGRPEDMVACYTCGRAGHPTCLQMTSKRLVAMVMSYDWRCIECKPCEICKEKGDDEKILFCDKCDRGTHYDCLDPPLSQPPDGSWACGKCIPLRQTSAAVGHQPRPPKPKHPNQYTNRPPQPNQYSRANQYTSTRPPQPNQYSRPSSSRLYSPDEYQAPGSSSVVSKRAVPRVSYRQDPDDYEEEDDGSPPPLPPRIRLKLKRQRAESEEEEDDDDVTSKLPFGGVLSGKDADTSRSKIGADDKDRFERSRKAAEIKLGGPRPPTQDPYASMPSTPQALGSPSPSGYYNNSPSTSNSHSDLFPSARPLRDQLLTSQTQDHHLYSRRSQDPSTPGPSNSISNTNSFPFAGSSNGGGPSVFEKIKCIRFGPFDIDTWYTAPYPEEYALVPDGRLWICEFCLKYMKSAFGAGRHRLKCKARHPPGDEVYRDGAVSVFEVDGRKNKIYCQNLCLLAKMFLDHKTLYYDVEPFLFYIMTETDDFGARFVGYFSKEKRSPMNYNVSCIMTLPVRQRKGWGNLLIDFSYLLSKKEARVGSPEKPLSDLGLLSYTNYWTVTLFFYLRSARSPVTIEAISQATSMTAEDILFVLKAKNMITIAHSSPPPPSLSRKTSSLTNSKNTTKARGSSSTPAAALPTSTTVVLHPRGAAVHTAETTRVTQANFIPQDYSIQWNREEVEQYLVKFEGKGWLRLRAENLKWTAFTDSLALRALKKKKEKVGVEEVGEKLVGVMEGAGVGGGVVVEGVDGALREGAGAGEVEGPVPMVVDEEPSKDHLEEAVVGNGIVDEDLNHLPLKVAPKDASIPAATEHAPAPAKPSASGSATIVDDSYPHSATSSPVFGPSFLLDDQPLTSTSQLNLQPDALPPPPASPTRARRSQSSQLASPPPSNPASQSDDPATLALVAALTSPNRRLRSSSASPTKPKTSEELQEHHSESSPRKRSTRNASAGVEGGGGASMETEVVGVALPSTTTTNGAGGRSTRSSPRKGAVSAEATDVEEEEGGVEVRV